MPKPREWFGFKAAGDDTGSAEIYIYDYIGKSWYNDRAMSATKLIEKLKECKGQHVDVHINSLGGDAFEGQAIHNALKRHEGGTTAYIDGIAYSAATHVALGCDTVVIAENALFGIHKAWTWCVGNEDEMLATAKALSKVDHTQIVVYAGKTGKSRDEILSTMVEDVPMTAEEALEAGYVDQIGDEVEEAALARSALDIAAHRIPDRFAARVAAFGVALSADGDSDLEDTIDLMRSHAAAIVELADEALESDETPEEAEDTSPSADGRRIVGPEVAALLTLTETERS